MADMPKPRVGIADTPVPNAFATGRNPNHAAVAVTAGLLDAMTWDEVRGVLAHELAHIRNRDILIGSVAAGGLNWSWAGVSTKVGTDGIGGDGMTASGGATATTVPMRSLLIPSAIQAPNE